ncbi:MAG: TetR family transcriptional regulator C-terminal domain-containing protein [Actinomycetota bacterium]
MTIAGISTSGSAEDRLVDATLQSIHRHGLGATTVTTITEIAGLSRGMVRHEFGSKQQLVMATMTRLCDRWLSSTEPDSNLSGAEQARSIVRAMFAPEAFNPVHVDAWLALSVEANSDPELRRLRDETERRWLAQLTVAYEASEVIDPQQAAAVTLAAADGLWLRRRVGRDGSETISDAASERAALRLVDALLGDPADRGSSAPPP